MKADELMIGDYVLYNGKPIQITYIYGRPLPDGSYPSNEAGWGHDEDCWVNTCNMTPIPLTKEILTANEWEDKGTYVGKRVQTSAKTNIDIVFFLNENILSIVEWIGDLEIRRFCNIVRHVHKLQHILKDCSLDHMVVFKIE